MANSVLPTNLPRGPFCLRQPGAQPGAIKQDMETRYKRLLRLEEVHAEKSFEPTEQQIRLIEKANPCFRERHVESSYPGQLLCQDTFHVGRLKGVGRIHPQAVVDTYGSFGFAKLYTSKRPETAVDVLYDRVLPFYQQHKLPVEAILTDTGTEYKGRPMIHMYEIFLEFNDIQHRTMKVGNPRTNGFVEQIWMPGCTTTTMSTSIAAIATWGADLLKPLKMGKRNEKN